MRTDWRQVGLDDTHWAVVVPGSPWRGSLLYVQADDRIVLEFKGEGADREAQRASGRMGTGAGAERALRRAGM